MSFCRVTVRSRLTHSSKLIVRLVAVALTIGSFSVLIATAQESKVRRTVGYLGTSSPSLEAAHVAAFRESLRQLGYVEGQNLIIAYRWAEGDEERFPVLARELVSLKPDVIVTAGTAAVLALKEATASIPIVTALAGDPVAGGLVSSLAKPGGNVTGLALLTEELEPKRLEILKQVVPGLARVAILLNPVNPYSAIAWKRTQPAAEALGVKLQRLEARDPNDLDRALAASTAARPQGLLVSGDRFLFAYRAAIIRFAAQNRLPAVFPWREMAQEGGLMAYGPDIAENYRRATAYVDKIFKGAKPADLPIEQPTKFEFVINLKTAKVLGLTIPSSVLLRADETLQ
jgi:putative tryptophan/tyrosine transport system substrate-binding protein